MELGSVAIVLVLVLLIVALWLKGDVKALVRCLGFTLSLEAKEKKIVRRRGVAQR